MLSLSSCRDLVVERDASRVKCQGYFKPKKCVWKHQFACLAYVSECKIPTSCVAKDDLLKAGLGEKTVEFPTLDCSAVRFREDIFNNIPKLRQKPGTKRNPSGSLHFAGIQRVYDANEEQGGGASQTQEILHRSLPHADKSAK